MIYLGDNWPDRYRNSVFTCNIHGHRVNHDRLERKGSGYVARHEPDFLLANDPWFRGLELKYGPDGAVYFTDWSDTGECHETDADNAHRENGRIYKISLRHGEARRGSNLAASSDEELARLQLHKNDWYVRTARRLLQERAAAGADLAKAHQVLRPILATHPDATRRLRALWALHATGGLNAEALIGPARRPRRVDPRLGDPPARRRRGAPSPETLNRFVALARTESSPRVLLSLASRSAAHPRQGPLAAGRGAGGGDDRPQGPDAAAHDLVRDRAAGGRRSRPGRRPGGRLQDSPAPQLRGPSRRDRRHAARA